MFSSVIFSSVIAWSESESHSSVILALSCDLISKAHIVFRVVLIYVFGCVSLNLSV